MLTAQNGASPNATQNFTLTVNQAPAITSGNSTTFQVGVAGSFTVTTTGTPTPSITEGGALPSGVTFHDNGNGTGTLSGTPAAAGTFNITFTAQNGVSPNATQNFTLTVQKANSTTSITSNSPNPSVVGQPVTINFSVTGNGTPTGNVTVTASTGETCAGSAPTGSCTLTLN